MQARIGRILAASVVLAIGALTWGQATEPSPDGTEAVPEEVIAPPLPAASRPAAGVPLAPAIDDVVHVDPITVKTKGKLPFDAFAMLAKATGTTIVGFNRNAVAGIGATVAVNMWGQHNAVAVDFDLDNAGYWEAVGKLAAHARFDTYHYERYCVELVPTVGYVEVATDTKAARVKLIGEPGTGMFWRGEVGLVLEVDPRLRLLSVGDLVFEGHDAQGNAVNMASGHAEFSAERYGHFTYSVGIRGGTRTVRPTAVRTSPTAGGTVGTVGTTGGRTITPGTGGTTVTPSRTPGTGGTTITPSRTAGGGTTLTPGRTATGLTSGTPTAGGAATITQSVVKVSGYIPVSLITGSKEVTFSTNAGEKEVTEGGWVVHLNSVSNEGTNTGVHTSVEVTISQAKGSTIPLPRSLDTVVELRDSSNHPVARAVGGTAPREGSDGWVRQTLDFSWTRADQPDVPSTVVVIVPTEVKAARVPFDMKVP